MKRARPWAAQAAHLEEGAALRGQFARLGILGQDGARGGAGDDALAYQVFHLGYLRLQHPHLPAHAPVALLQGLGLGGQLFLQYGQVGVDVVQLLAVGGVGLQEVLIPLLLPPLGGNLLLQGGNLAVHVIAPAVRGLEAAQQFLALQAQL